MSTPLMYFGLIGLELINEGKLISEKNRLKEIEEDLKDALAREDGMKTRIENMFKKVKETNDASDTVRKELKAAKKEIEELKK